MAKAIWEDLITTAVIRVNEAILHNFLPSNIRVFAKSSLADFHLLNIMVIKTLHPTTLQQFHVQSTQFFVMY